MDINLDIVCSCDNPDNRMRIITKNYGEFTDEIWVKCDCGEEAFLCDDGDIIR